jgi:NADPH-dependent glutamate synthase beta subunit-like oxidoreductase/NAD-dependent dihydropyrimidine dehydrogenase PreA subunit
MDYLNKASKLPAPTREKVAIVGSGPAGIMCAFELSKKGYKVTIFERKQVLGGALRYIPKYRLPTEQMDNLINNIIRIGNITVKTDVDIGPKGKSIDELKKEGFKAIFMAPGTPNPRILSIDSETPEFKKIIQRLVDGDDTKGVRFGLNLLYIVDRGDAPLDLYEGKKIIVIGGGNVAFDVARTARRLGGDITVMCLENDDKSTRDGIPADIEEIEGAEEEGIKIIYSRGVDGIKMENDRFKSIKTLRCISVYEENGAFNPKFDHDDVKYIEGDVLLITIGQAPEKALFEKEGLLNEKGRLDIDQLTLMSNCKKGIFIGGDVKRVGFASEAMRDGSVAAESIDRFIQGKDLKESRSEKEYESASIPKRIKYKDQPKIKWSLAEERMNFKPFEKEYRWEEVLEEAKRCLCCGPCLGCKACVELNFQKEIPEIKIDENLCSGCGVCVNVCPYDALELKEKDGKTVAELDILKCKRCGVCVSACPTCSITIKDDLKEKIIEELT